MKPSHFFPWRLFRWFVVRELAFAVGIFVILTVAIYAVTGDLRIRGLGLATLSMAALSIFVAYRLLLPLGRLIEKTKRMRESPFASDDDEPIENLAFDEPGEWYELERALNRLGRDLRHKTIRLSREKTELRAIMSAVSEAVLAIGSDRRVLFYNPQFAYLFGAANLLSNPRISEILRAPDILSAYDQVLTSGLPLRREVEEVVSDERLPRHFLLSVAPLKKKHNEEIYGVVGMFHDITELKQTEKIRIEFVGNVSHELRTPLTTVNGYLQTLASDISQNRFEHAIDFLKIVTGNVERMKSLVEDLLDLSALESGKELQIEMVDVQDVTEAVTRQVPCANHKVQVQYDFNQMPADAKRLEQVLRNLLENAVRYVPEGKNINIRWLKTPTHFELRVKDDGPGIDPKHQGRLFERFYRVDEARSRATGGTGIGLSLVKHIVQRHGGQVQVRSQIGQGSEFICDFPVKN